MKAGDLAAEFAAAMAYALAQGAPWPGAVAVSGGADSTALMHLMAEWARGQGRGAPIVLTVDHGLRPGSGRVARSVVEQARELGLAARKLVWKGDKPEADIEAAAREARYRLMGGWCARHGVKGLYIAHTREDQAETFLLRLARGSGLDGLAAMRVVAAFPVPGNAHPAVVRPLLGMARRRLRDALEARGLGWSEDPMNADPRFARARLRAAWPSLEALGLTPARIASAACHLGRARDALEAATTALVEEACRFEEDRILLDAVRFAAAPREIGLRALAHLLARLSGAPYRPRFERLERLYDAVVASAPTAARTLQGCRIGRAPKPLRVFGAATLMLTREPGRR